MLFGLLGSESSLFAQTPIVQIHYEVEKTTTFQLDDENHQVLSDYDKIVLMPTAVNEIHSEVIYDNGDMFTEIIPSFPLDAKQSWQISPSRIVINQNVREIYVADTLFESYTIPPRIDPIPAEEYAPLYLGTAQWELPMPDSVVQEYENEGYIISINTDSVLFYENASEGHLYNAVEMVEQHIIYDSISGDALSSELTGYTTDENGYFVYDFKIERYLKTHRVPCYEKVIFTDYKNIEKVYLDPSYAPSAENGYSYTQNTEIIYPQISAQQIGTSNSIEVLFADDVPNDLVIDIRDLSGNTVLHGLNISRENNLFSSESLRTGVYNIIVINHLVQSTRFIFIQ